MHINEKVLCVSKDGSRIGYKKTRKQKIIDCNHIFKMLKPSSEPKHLSNSEECSVCCNTFDDCGIYTTKCGHKFHIECIVTWYSKQVSCPLCRCKDISSPLNIIVNHTP